MRMSLLVRLLIWRNSLNYQITRNKEWHDNMHMYDNQLPRRLLPKDITPRSAYRPTPQLHTYIHDCRRQVGSSIL
jgi:hypothetical protein